MSATTRIIFIVVAFCSILLPSIEAYTCYVASSSDANFPNDQWTQANNCTACVRGKYVYTHGRSGTIWVWGCMTGSTGMIAQNVVYQGAPNPTWTAPPAAWGNWGAVPAPATWTVPNFWTGGFPWTKNADTSSKQANPWANWAVGQVGSWAGWNVWTGPPGQWGNWGAPYAPPAQPFTNANMCVDGSFDGYSNSLRAYAYMCVCCGDLCNRDLRCKTFNSASTVSSSVAMLTFAVVSLLHA